MGAPGRKKTSSGMSTNVDKMKEFDSKVLKIMHNLLKSRDEAIKNIMELEKGYSDVTFQDFKRKFSDNSKKIDDLSNHLKATSEYYKKNISLTEKHLSAFFK